VKIYLQPKIKEILKIHFLTSRKIAKEIGITEHYFSTLSNGLKPIGAKSADKLWKILEEKGVKKEDIFIFN